MSNPADHEVDNHKVRIRCPDCRTHFHERLRRVVHGDKVACPSCHIELRFTGIGHMHQHDSPDAYIKHVEACTARPHFLRNE